ncbi:dynein axonemal assembly factor 1 homolog [Eriocheir sinensis]|uniref:dynein axonemal assembly factor 1 homolog n=1 Tax=Eriocheir sinensis TaxID=95602 RepID=UPI0021C5BD35|nr:dynein axonemal assembly factor 1 homolog [Eriocheir sinensis]
MEEDKKEYSGPRMTRENLRQLCKDHHLYSVPALNDVLYLHFQGYTEIENLEEYTGLRCLWLENNGLRRISGLDHLRHLRSLHLHHNLLTSLAGIQHLPTLVTLNVAHNMISNIEHLSGLAHLETLQVNHNRLTSVDCLAPLATCPALCSVDLSYNSLKGPGLALVLGEVRELRCVQATGNPATREVRPYRNTFILTCPQLTYLDDRPVFPVDRAAAEAWRSGGLDAERATRREWAEREHRRQRECVNDLLKLRERVLAERAAKEKEVSEGAGAAATREPSTPADWGIFVQDNGNEKIYALTPEAKQWAIKRLRKDEEEAEKEPKQEREVEGEADHSNQEKETNEPHSDETQETPDLRDEKLMDDQIDLSQDEGFKRLLGFLSDDSDDVEAQARCVLNNTINTEKSREINRLKDPEEIVILSPEDSITTEFIYEKSPADGKTRESESLIDLEITEFEEVKNETERQVVNEHLKELEGSEESVSKSSESATETRETLVAARNSEYDSICPRLSLPLRYQEEEEEDEDDDHLFFRSCQNFILASTASNTDSPDQKDKPDERRESPLFTLPHQQEEEENDDSDNDEEDRMLLRASQNFVIAPPESSMALDDQDVSEEERGRPPSPNLDSDQYTQAFLRQLVARHNASSENQSDIEEILENLDLDAQEAPPTHPRHPHAAILQQLADRSEPESGEDEEPITRRQINGRCHPMRRVGLPIYGEGWVEEVRRRILEDADWEEEILSSSDTSEEEGSVDDLNVETPEESSMAEDDSSWQEDDSVFEESVENVSSASPRKVLDSGRVMETNDPLAAQLSNKTSIRTNASLNTRKEEEEEDEEEEEEEMHEKLAEEPSISTSCSSMSLPSINESLESNDEGETEVPQILPPGTAGEETRGTEVVEGREGLGWRRGGRGGAGSCFQESQHPQVRDSDVITVHAPGSDSAQSARTTPAAPESATPCVSGGDASTDDAAPPVLPKEGYSAPQERVGRRRSHDRHPRHRESTLSTHDALRSSHEAFVSGYNITGRSLVFVCILQAHCY